MTKLPTVEETKIQVAAEYGCENYEHDYEFGLGISKLMDPFEFMERVCESHTAAHTAGLREENERLRNLLTELYDWQSKEKKKPRPFVDVMGDVEKELS